MLIVMKANATADEVSGVVEVIEAKGLRAHPLAGAATGVRRTTARVDPHVARIAVGRQRQALPRALHAHHRRRVARPEHRVALHGRVVLAVRKPPAAQVG